MSTDVLIFLGMVFVAAFLLATSVMVPTIGTESKATRRLRNRIKAITESFDRESINLLRQSRLNKMNPLDRKLENIPGMSGLNQLIEQAGYSIPAYRFVLIMLVSSIFVFIAMYFISKHPIIALFAASICWILPLQKLRIERSKRMSRFEEQLPEALDIMSRALRAGHPFTETLNLVAEEMDSPIAYEFGRTFSDINYGVSIKQGFLSLLERIPSMSLMTVITAVLIQRETGGNMAEILDKISAVVRSRFRFQRKVRTLSAEGRLSAWILTLVPFVLAAVIMLLNPDYLPMLTKDPLGRDLIVTAFVMISVGILWIRKLIRIDV